MPPDKKDGAANAKIDKALTPIISIAEYRELLKDTTSTDEKILERLRYIEAFCRNVIKIELEKYQKNYGKDSNKN